ncbi:MAG: CCA tRNA nucleotidyltransferase [Candidatus Coproplasma sp.]
MINIIPEKLKQLAASCGFPLYVVGGACRDFLAGLSPRRRDWDICAPVGAEELTDAARQCGFNADAVYANTGTVKLSADGEEYEFASFRSDEYVRGSHRPERTFFTADIGLDARRRDFKCNAVYYDVLRGEFTDPLGGIADIKGKILSTVAPARKVFGEDGLRLMRLCRQAAELGFSPDPDCLEGAHLNARLISDISAERVWTELNLTLHADEKYGIKYGQYRGLELLKETGVLAYILPELAAGDGMLQRSDFHSHDVLEHSLRCVKYADNSVRLAALLHDVGKPVAMKESGKFAGHESVGEDIVRNICSRLRVPKKLAERTARLTRLHMYDMDCAARESKVRRFIVVNHDILPELLLLKQADYSACKDDLSPAPGVVKWKKIYSAMEREGVPMSLKELAVRGDTLIDAGICPDEVGKILNKLLCDCALDARLNRREKLVSLALAYAENR